MSLSICLYESVCLSVCLSLSLILHPPPPAHSQPRPVLHVGLYHVLRLCLSVSPCVSLSASLCVTSVSVPLLCFICLYLLHVLVMVISRQTLFNHLARFCFIYYSASYLSVPPLASSIFSLSFRRFRYQVTILSIRANII